MKEKILALLPTRIYLELKYWNFRKSNRQTYKHLQNMRQLTADKDYSYKLFDDKPFTELKVSNLEMVDKIGMRRCLEMHYLTML